MEFFLAGPYQFPPNALFALGIGLAFGTADIVGAAGADSGKVTDT
jgi:hypothetical protein